MEFLFDFLKRYEEDMNNWDSKKYQDEIIEIIACKSQVPLQCNALSFNKNTIHTRTQILRKPEKLSKSPPSPKSLSSLASGISGSSAA